MREHAARVVCLIALAMAVSLSWAFAVRHNPADGAMEEPVAAAGALPAPSPEPSAASPGKAPPPASPSAEIIARGVAAYKRHNCATCHAIAGEGNPRYPLDGTGSRWEPDELREWITGTGVAADVLNTGILRRKQRYREMPEEDLAALVAYLSTLKERAG